MKIFVMMLEISASLFILFLFLYVDSISISFPGFESTTRITNCQQRTEGPSTIKKRD